MNMLVSTDGFLLGRIRPLLSSERTMAFSFQGSRADPAAPGDRSPETGRDGHRLSSDRLLSLLFLRQAAPAPFLRRKEVIHPLVLEGIPCFDLTPITGPALGAASPCGLGSRFRALPALMV